MADHTDSLTVHGEHGTTIFTLSGPTLVVHRASDKKWPRIETTVRHVLWAEVKENLFEIALVARRKNSHPLSLVLVAGTVKSDQLEIATAFTTSLMDVAYAGIRRQRRLRVLVNPKSGPGNGIGLYHRKVEPIFRAAHCHVELTLTTHHGHAYELMKTLDLGQYDAIVVVSGDGLVHEIINGFAEHARPEEAFRLPITPVAGGSGNALALNILGPKEGCDICAAALNAVKGRPMRIDLCSVTQGEKKTLSFISQCVGMLADVDLGTEHLRFLGSNRFVLGYVYGALRKKQCPIKLSYKPAETDKRQMVYSLHEYQSKAREQLALTNKVLSSEHLAADADSASFVAPFTPVIATPPELKSVSAPDSEAKWVSFDKPLIYVYAGKGPWVSRDLMQFPVALPDDGLIDIVVQEQSLPRRGLLRAMDGSGTGQPYWMPSQHYIKAQAYRIEPCSRNNLLSIDGERYPFETFEVECLPRHATVLSPYGWWQAEFALPESNPK